MPAIRASRTELDRLARRIQVLKLEVDELRAKMAATVELEAVERTLDRLRWRLEVIARRMAPNDLDDAA